MRLRAGKFEVAEIGGLRLSETAEAATPSRRTHFGGKLALVRCSYPTRRWPAAIVHSWQAIRSDGRHTSKRRRGNRCDQRDRCFPIVAHGQWSPRCALALPEKKIAEPVGSAIDYQEG